MNTWTRIVRMTMTVIATGALIAAAGCNKGDKEAAAGASAPGVSATAPAAAPIAPLAARAPAEPKRDPATVLVTVGTAKLTLGEVDKQLAPMLAQMGDDPRVTSMKGRFYQQAAERFVMRTVLTQEADRRKIAVTEAEVNAAVATITNRMPAGMTLESALARDGKSVADFRADLASELRIKSLVESEVPTNSAVSDAEVQEMYEKQKDHMSAPETVSARHILIKTEKGDAESVRAEKKAKAEALRKQLVDGADFAKLAKENSDCPSKERGGDLGSFGRGQMVKPFEDAAFGQATNAIGPVVETDFGYHIIQVMAHKPAGASSLADVKERLTEKMKQRKQMESFDVFLAKLKSDAKITYADGFKPSPVVPEQTE